MPRWKCLPSHLKVRFHIPALLGAGQVLGGWEGHGWSVSSLSPTQGKSLQNPC